MEWVSVIADPPRLVDHALCETPLEQLDQHITWPGVGTGTRVVIMSNSCLH